MRYIFIGAVVGAIPGVVMMLLAGLVSGEVELTLGVGGILLALVGMLMGAIVGSRKR